MLCMGPGLVLHKVLWFVGPRGGGSVCNTTPGLLVPCYRQKEAVAVRVWECGRSVWGCVVGSCSLFDHVRVRS